MKHFIALLLFLTTPAAHAVDVKISQLPLGAGSSVGVNDSFPYVQASTNVTRRLTLWDLINLPPLVSTYAPKASPTFTGTVTAPSFVGALTGNASTASALAANPTDCASNTFANAIAANGNLTCSSVGVPAGGTGLASGTAGGVLAFTASTTLASSLGGSSGQILRSAGTAVPTWSTATYPATTTVSQLLYSSSANTVAGLATANTGVLVTDSSGVPSIQACATANRVLRTNGTALTCSQVAAATDVSGQVPIANGGTGQATKAAGFDALSPMSASGDLIYGGASGTGTRLAKGSDGQLLQLVSGLPAWSTVTTPVYAYYFGYMGGGNANWPTTGTTLSNPSGTKPSAGSLTTVQSSGLGTVTQLNVAGTSYYPGITVTPTNTGKYFVTATVSMENTTLGNQTMAGLYDDTSSTMIDNKSYRAAIANSNQALVLNGIVSMTAATAKTLVIQTATSANTATIVSSNGNVDRVITWNITYVGP